VLTDTDPAALQVVLIGEGDNVPQALLDAATTSSRSRRGRPENNRIAMHESGSGPNATSERPPEWSAYRRETGSDWQTSQTPLLV